MFEKKIDELHTRLMSEKGYPDRESEILAHIDDLAVRRRAAGVSVTDADVLELRQCLSHTGLPEPPSCAKEVLAASSSAGGTATFAEIMAGLKGKKKRITMGAKFNEVTKKVARVDGDRSVSDARSRSHLTTSSGDGSARASSRGVKRSLG